MTGAPPLWRAAKGLVYAADHDQHLTLPLADVEACENAISNAIHDLRTSLETAIRLRREWMNGEATAAQYLEAAECTDWDQGYGP